MFPQLTNFLLLTNGESTHEPKIEAPTPQETKLVKYISSNKFSTTDHALTQAVHSRRFSHVRRYAMLQQSDAEDRLLGDDDADDEDDVPPLDLNPDRPGRGGRLAVEDDDDRSDLFQPG